MTLTAVSQLTYAQSAFKSSLPVKPAKGVTVSGTVECDGQPVAGIKVSDGYEVTKTDKNGAYYLKSKKKNPQVFISFLPVMRHGEMTQYHNTGQISQRHRQLRNDLISV